ncbi:FHA domain-containing protein [Melittangium boletus]|uniref:FHA domain-containing protein n=1 Tax=Melittangium boletus DSM 14713 TaxID=1294270 RepID=A0A250I638_9BACT|nr:FHA domain-containing protein [Melittangium boletus]ATB26643.1 FHA domain-containing protein [Melittangium boletus DSM 14713]
MPTLVIRHPDGNESEHELSGELKIGRQAGTNDLTLAEGGVSRRHARFFLEGSTVMVEDVGSANGTFVDGQRITGPTVLTAKSQVLMGDYALRLKGPASRPTGARKSVKPAEGEALGSGRPAATRAAPAAGGKRPPSALAKRPAPAGAAPGEEEPGLFLKGLTGPWANKKYPLTGKLLVGRQAPAAVVLDDDSVSRRHAEVEDTPKGPTVRDLGSANGTFLNGEPLGTEPEPLVPGDVITFGMVEVVLEGTSTTLPTLQGRTAALKPGSDMADAAPGAGSRKRLLIVAASVVGVLLLAGIAKSVSGGDDRKASGPVAAPVRSQAEQLQELMSECRSYSSSEMGSEPDWAKAETACSKALDLDPIHAEANTLMRRIKTEKEAAGYFSAGTKAMQRLKEEEALDAFQKIPKESLYFRRAKPKVLEAVQLVMKRTGDDCKRYIRDNEFRAAVPKCERYMSFACQKMDREELEPPLGFTLVLDSRRRLGRTEWRPKDKMYIDFLTARQKVTPNAEPWHCPVSDIFMADSTGPNPKTLVEDTFKQRYPHKFMVEAMLDYWGGRGNEAITMLQRLRNNYEMAQYHADTDKLLKSVSNVDQLFKVGQGYLQSEDVEKAAESFREALEVDKQLMDTLFDSRPSFYRRNIQQDMAAKSIIRGKYWSDRGNARRACLVWKLGFGFYAGNTDLNQDVGRCSTQALQAFKEAQTCSEVDNVMDLAVPGDGVAEMISAWKKENGC